ncbi:MAG: HNH endonuclease [Saprospiraceae bacterium]|nr:HNH endonuclease [Saprospiraceae bacterium]
MKESLKKEVRERAKNCCEYCLVQAKYSGESFSIEHIIPLIKGGLSVLFNLAFSCQRCNNHKYTATTAVDPATGSLVTLYNPRTDIWAEHFEWREYFTEIIGISPIGRATVNRLQLNRDGLVNLRRVLVDAGLHPPF